MSFYSYNITLLSLIEKPGASQNCVLPAHLLIIPYAI